MQKLIFKWAMMCLTSGMTHLALRLSFILLLLPVVLLQTGCSSTDTSPSGNVDSSGQPVSSVPWNKPEQWETTGQLGGMTGQ
jgi:hypothetical protein